MSRRKSPQVAKRPRSSASSAASKAEPAGNPNGAPTPLPVKRRFLRTEVWGLLLLACALLFNAWYVAPELRIGRVPLNDGVYHLAASARLLTGLERGAYLCRAHVSADCSVSGERLPGIAAAGIASTGGRLGRAAGVCVLGHRRPRQLPPGLWLR